MQPLKVYQFFWRKGEEFGRIFVIDQDGLRERAYLEARKQTDYAQVTYETKYDCAQKVVWLTKEQ